MNIPLMIKLRSDSREHSLQWSTEKQLQWTLPLIKNLEAFSDDFIISIFYESVHVLLSIPFNTSFNEELRRNSHENSL